MRCGECAPRTAAETEKGVDVKCNAMNLNRFSSLFLHSLTAQQSPQAQCRNRPGGGIMRQQGYNPSTLQVGGVSKPSRWWHREIGGHAGKLALAFSQVTLLP